MKEERLKQQGGKKKRIKSQEELDADNVRREIREQENIKRCLVVADSNQKYIAQKEQKIKEMKDRTERDSRTEANKLRDALQKSKKS